MDAPNDDTPAAVNIETGFTVPDHVVFRSFANETVLLNLETGGYHGLNPVAGRMFELLDREGSPRMAVEGVLDEWDVDRTTAERDALALCGDLLERGLLERSESPAT